MVATVELTGIELVDIKNVNHGEIDFRSPVTGIYGQNGSGKTTVIDALQTIRTLLAGGDLAHDDCFVGLIRQHAGHAAITATFNTSLGTADYTVRLDDTGDGCCRVGGETLAIKYAGERRRILFDHETAIGDLGAMEHVTRPLVQWKSLRSVRKAVAARLGEEETLSRSESRSYLFSATMRSMLDELHTHLTADSEAVTEARLDALHSVLEPTRTLVSELAGFAEEHMRIVTTREGASVCFGYAPVHKGNIEGLIDVGRPVVVSASLKHIIDLMVRQANIVMPKLVPGLELVCEMRDDEMPDGSPGVKVFLRSRRGEVVVPFWAESEGVRRIVGILTLLVRMFNEPGMLVAIDEIDDGVFENLLGELLETLEQRGEGRLLFTAHNLRALEMLDKESIVFSTTDPDKRFVRPKGVHGTNNLRDMYIRAINTGGGAERLADKVKQADIAYALILAGEEQ